MALGKTLAIEFFGTFFWVLLFTFGAGQNEINGTGGASAPAIAFGLGLFLYATSSAFGDKIGCSFNPAVTFTMMLSKNVPALKGLVCMATQFLAGIVGALVKLAFTTHNYSGNLHTEMASEPRIEGEVDLPTIEPATIEPPPGVVAWQKADAEAPFRRLLSPAEGFGGMLPNLKDRAKYNDQLSDFETWARPFTDEPLKFVGPESLESSDGGDFFLEFFAMLLVLFVVLNVGLSNKSPNGPLAYGLAMCAACMSMYVFNDGSVSLNPARAFGTALLESTLSDDKKYFSNILGESAGAAHPTTNMEFGDHWDQYQKNYVDWWSSVSRGQSFYVWACAPLIAAPVACLLYKLVRGTCEAGAASASRRKID